MPTADAALTREPSTRSEVAAPSTERDPGPVATRRRPKGRARLPPRHRGPARHRDPHGPRAPRRPPVARRLRRRRRLLRHLGLPHHRSARRRAVAHRDDLVDPLRRPPHPAAAARRGARPRRHGGRLVRRRARAAAPRHRHRHRGGRGATSSTGSSRAARSTTWPPTRCPSPVQHFWSLAVEEQFYVVWPLLLIARGAARAAPQPPGRAWPRSGLLVAVARSCGRCGSRTPRPARPSSRRRPASGSSASAPLLAVALAGRPRPAAPARGSAALGWAALVALARRRRSGSPKASTGRAPGRCCRPCRPRCSSGSAGRAPRARPGPGPRRPRRWSGSAGCRTRSTSGTGRSSSSGRGRADAVGATLPAWGRLALAVVVGRPRVAVVALRRDADPPRPAGCATVPGPCSRRASRSRCAGVLAALPLLPLRSPFDTTPPAAGCRRSPSSARPRVRPDQPLRRRRRPRLGHADPLVSGEDRPEADVDHCQVDVAVTEPVACTFGDPRARPPSPSSATPRRCSGSRHSRRRPRAAAGGSSPTGKSSCAFSDAPATQAGAAYPECDAWNAAVVDAAARGPARRRRHLRRRDERLDRQRHRTPRPSSRATPRAGARSRTPGCPSSSSATARSHPTTSTSAPTGTPASSPGAPSPAVPRSPAAGWPSSARRPPPRVAGVSPARPHARGSARASCARSSSATSRSTGPATTSPRRTPRRWPRRSALAVDDALAR